MGAVGGVLRFGIGAFFKTGTTIGTSEPRALGSTAPVLAFEVSGLTPPVVGGLSVAGVVGLAGKLELDGIAVKSGLVALEFVLDCTPGLTGVGAVSGFT